MTVEGFHARALGWFRDRGALTSLLAATRDELVHAHRRVAVLERRLGLAEQQLARCPHCLDEHIAAVIDLRDRKQP